MEASESNIQPVRLDDEFRKYLQEFPIRDFIYGFVDFDIEAQLLAIKYLLHRHREEDKSLAQEIKDAEERIQRLSGMRQEFAEHEWHERLHQSIYQDAAHSMAALGMIAPLIETLFYQTFLSIGQQYFPLGYPPINENKRWIVSDERVWDCHFLFTKDRVIPDLARGIIQIIKATGFDKMLPADLNIDRTLSALFCYRNKMFHLGFEWPKDERSNFMELSTQSKWPSEWFTQATSGNKPWIIYLSEPFIAHCLRTIDCIVESFGYFIRDELTGKRVAVFPKRNF